MAKHKKLEIQHIISITISIIIVLIVISNLLIINFPNQESKYIAKKGVLDIRDWKIDREGNIKLDGEWEFYPGVLLKPEETKSDGFKKYEKIRKYVKVPGPWKDYLNEEGSSDGSGTYRIIVRVPEDEIYGIKTRTIRTASRIYLNGQEFASVGNLSINKTSY